MDWPAHLPADQLAWLTGIPIVELANYQKAPISIPSTVVEQIEIAAATVKDNAIVRHRLLSYPQLGLAIRDEHLKDPTFCQQLILRSVQQLSSLDNDTELHASTLLRPLPGTGNGTHY